MGWGPDVSQHIRDDIRAVSAYIDADPSAYRAKLAGVWEFLQQDRSGIACRSPPSPSSVGGLRLAATGTP